MIEVQVGNKTVSPDLPDRVRDLERRVEELERQVAALQARPASAKPAFGTGVIGQKRR